MWSQKTTKNQRRRRQKTNMRKKIKCLNCGKLTKRYKFCKDECKKKFHSNNVCVICGKKTSNPIFCSRKCYGKWRQRQKKKKMVKKKCEQCGKVFRYYNLLYPKGRKFHNRNCYFKFRKGRSLKWDAQN